jgi:hypothetical protein
MIVLLAAEPVLAWFIFPTLLLGILVAAGLHSSQSSPGQQDDEQRPAIQIAKIPVKGAMGLVFTIGTRAIFFVALPQVRWFLVLALPSGALIGAGLYLWHKRHP